MSKVPFRKMITPSIECECELEYYDNQWVIESDLLLNGEKVDSDFLMEKVSEWVYFCVDQYGAHACDSGERCA